MVSIKGAPLRASGAMLGLAAPLVLLACSSSGSAVQCTADSAQQPVVDIMKEQLEQRVGKALRHDDTSRPVSLSKIRAAIAQLVISLQDIRTSKVDPNSTKRFCAATVKIRFPAETLDDADRARSTAGLNSVSDLADAADIERHADSFTSPIEFNVQPTDDGSKVFAETESGGSLLGFAAELLSSALVRGVVEDAQRQQQEAASQQAAEQSAAQTEQRSANLASAQTENQLATQTITAAWRALPAAGRHSILPLQRSWIRKKTADCAVEAASSSVDATEREMARLACDTRITNERVTFLNGLRSQAEFSPDASQADVTMMSNDTE